MASRIISIPCSGGLQTKVAEQLVPPGEFLELENVDLNLRNAFRLRRGYEALSSDVVGTAGAAFANQAALFYRENELCVIANDRLWTYLDDANGWVDQGPFTITDLRIRTLSARRVSQSFADRGQAGEAVGVTWEEAGAIYVSVVNPSEGSVLLDAIQVAAIGTRPRVIGITDWLFFTYVDGSGVVQSGTWVPEAAQTAPVFAAALATSGNIYDICDEPAFNTGLVASQFSAGGDLRVVRITRSNALAGAFAFASGGAIKAVNINANIPFLAGQRPQLSWIDGSATIETASILSDLTGTFALNTLAVSVTGDKLATGAHPLGNVGQTLGRLVYSVEVTAADTRNSTVTYFSADQEGATATELATQTNASILSHPFPAKRSVYQPFVYTGTDNGVVLLADTDTAEICGRAYEDGRATGRSSRVVVPTGQQQCCAAVFTSRFPTVLNESVTFDGQDNVGELCWTVEDNSRSPGELARNSHLATGGFLYGYDGRYPYEADWHVLPEIEGFTEQGGGDIPVGTYSYAVTWEWTDAHGRLHRSGPTIDAFSVTGINNSIDIEVRTLNLTAKQNVKIAIWRGRAGDASQLFRVTDPSVANNPAVSSITVNDGLSDQDLELREPLDQAGDNAVLQSDPTPATRFCTFAEDRLWFRDPERQNLLRYSLTLRNGYGPQLSPRLALDIPTRQALTAAGTQDGAIFAFSEDTISVFQGAGLDNLGNGQGFSVPQELPVEVGATRQETVARIPIGLVYGSPRGPRQLARDRQSAAWAQSVEQLFLDEGQQITSATYRPDTGDLMLTDDGPDTGTLRRTVRYNVVTARWASDKPLQALDASVATDGEFSILRTNGKISRAQDLFEDGNSPIRQVITTAWIHLGNYLQPSQTVGSITILGKYRGPHNLLVKVGYDYSDFFNDIATFNPNNNGLRSFSTWGGDSSWALPGSGWTGPYPSNLFPVERSSNAYQHRFQITRGCEAVRVRVEDVALGSPPFGETFSLTSIEIEFSDYDDALYPLDPRRMDGTA